MIKLLVPSMPSAQSILKLIKKINSNQYYTNFGPLVFELEKTLASELNTSKENVSTVSSATLGLELALKALNLKPGSRILIPAFSFVATATAVVRAGHIPIFSDVEENTWIMTPRLAKLAYDSFELDVVMPVSAFGNPFNPDDWDQFSIDNNIPVIIDAAGAFGNQRVGKKILVVYSLHATKNLSAAEGGLVAGPYELVNKIRELSNFGISKELFGAISYIGTNAKLSEYHAAICLANYTNWSKQSKQRIKLHNFYKSLINKNQSFEMQARPDDGIYTIEPILLPKGIDVNLVINDLFLKKIETRRWYYPLLTKNTVLSQYLKASELTISEDISARLIGIPFHLYLKKEDLKFIIRQLNQSVLKYTK